MGALTSRQNAGAEEPDIVSNHAYKYPPRSGNYFGSHFIMGGERFDTPQPEAYLFGENADLNFLGSRPTPFPYPPPQSNEPTKTLKSLVNIRKESLRFVRCPEPVGKLVENNKIGDGPVKSAEGNGKGTYYNIEFTFDCDARIAITIYYFCTEELTPTGVVYYPRDPQMTSQTYHYKKGANQQFCQILHVFDPSKHPEEDLIYNADREIMPVAVYCVVDEGQEEIRQSHTTIAIVEKHTDGTYVLKALKQKLFVDGLCYLLQEIYGIENKNLDTKTGPDSEPEDGGGECVICMCDARDTVILPCRHLCLCNSCADSLRYQANNCPICRAPFRALLQIRALQKVSGGTAPAPLMPPTAADGSLEHIPAGYEAVSLLEALNGPSARPAAPALPLPAPPAPPAPPAATIASPDTDQDHHDQAAEVLNRGGASKPKPKEKSVVTPEFRMSVLLAREQAGGGAAAGGERGEGQAASSPLLTCHARINGTTARDKSKTSLCAEYADEGSASETEAEQESAVELDTEPAAELDADPDAELDAEQDSDNERTSPLLASDSTAKMNGSLSARATPEPAPAPAPADPAPRAQSAGREEAESPPIASDSDYFTPEEPTTTILTAPKQARLTDAPHHPLAADSGPQRWALPHHVTSLPGTPLSQSSVRSSGDSYSSTSSSRQLLTAPPAPAPAPAPAAPASAGV